MNGVRGHRQVFGHGAPHVLLVDDNLDLLVVLGMFLEGAGLAVATATDAADALCLAAETDFSIAVVDYQLGGSSMDGLELIARLHNVSPLTVCLLITVHNRGHVGFQAAKVGAFRYLSKPFPINSVLVDAIRAALDERRRREWMRSCLCIGDPSAGLGQALMIDLAARAATVAGEPVSLGELEFDLLAYLARHPGRAVSYDELWREVWGYDGRVDKGLIQRTTSRLREKIGKEWIVCVRRRGYRLRQTGSRFARRIVRKLSEFQTLFVV